MEKEIGKSFRQLEKESRERELGWSAQQWEDGNRAPLVRTKDLRRYIKEAEKTPSDDRGKE